MNDSYNIKNLSKDNLKRLINNQHIFLQHYKNKRGNFYRFFNKNIFSYNVNGFSIKDYEINQKKIEKIQHLFVPNLLKKIKIEINLRKYNKKNRIKIVSNDIRKHYYLSVASIVKNEGKYLKEWIEFHILAGVEKFYIFDNESDDDTKIILKPYIKKGIVDYIFFPGKAVQYNAYNYIIKKLRKKTFWLALIDADEFLFPTEDISLPDFLKNYEKFPAIGVNWITFGHCNHEKQQDGLLVDNYQMTFTDKDNPLNCRIKSIVRPKCVSYCNSPHFCHYKHGFAVDENMNTICGPSFESVFSNSITLFNSAYKIRINHYWTKSKEELKEKIKRGYPDGASVDKYENIIKRLDFPLVNDKKIIEFKNKRLKNI